MNLYTNAVVVCSTGQRATVNRLMQDHEKAELQLADGRILIVPTDLIVQRDDGELYLPFDPWRFEVSPAGSHQDRMGTETVIPVVEEQARIEKRRVETGRVRIRKEVTEDVQTVRHPVVRETVHVERVAVDRFLDEPAQFRREGDTMIIPVMEEVIVIEKKLRLKEELHVRTVRETVEEPVEVTSRREQVIVSRESAED